MRSDIEIVQNADAFDGAWYLECYPDVLNSGLSPAEHYYKYGWRMGRDPSSAFSTSDYLENHPDCIEKNVNPLVHQALDGKVASRKLAKIPREVTVASEGLESYLDKVERQLIETQKLLEHYYSRYQSSEIELNEERGKKRVVG